MAFDTHAAVKALTDAGASEPLAGVDVAREASRDATGELVTRAHLRHRPRAARVPPRAWRLVTAGGRDSRPWWSQRYRFLS